MLYCNFEINANQPLGGAACLNTWHLAVRKICPLCSIHVYCRVQFGVTAKVRFSAASVNLHECWLEPNAHTSYRCPGMKSTVPVALTKS